MEKNAPVRNLPEWDFRNINGAFQIQIVKVAQEKLGPLLII